MEYKVSRGGLKALSLAIGELGRSISAKLSSSLTE